MVELARRHGSCNAKQEMVTVLRHDARQKMLPPKELIYTLYTKVQ